MRFSGRLFSMLNTVPSFTGFTPLTRFWLATSVSFQFQAKLKVVSEPLDQPLLYCSTRSMPWVSVLRPLV